MALEPIVHTILAIVINTVLFYLAAAIMCSIMFRREVKKWSWLNLILGIVAACAWVFRLNLNFLGSAATITFGIIIFFLCWILWVLGGGISERRAIYATLGSMLIWFAFSWLLLIIFQATGWGEFSSQDFPTLLSWPVG